MGNAQSESHSYGDMALGTARMRLPMPDPEELEKKFNKVLVSNTIIYIFKAFDSQLCRLHKIIELKNPGTQPDNNIVG